MEHRYLFMTCAPMGSQGMDCSKKFCVAHVFRSHCSVEGTFKVELGWLLLLLTILEGYRKAQQCTS